MEALYNRAKLFEHGPQSPDLTKVSAAAIQHINPFKDWDSTIKQQAQKDFLRAKCHVLSSPKFAGVDHALINTMQTQDSTVESCTLEIIQTTKPVHWILV